MNRRKFILKLLRTTSFFALSASLLHRLDWERAKSIEFSVGGLSATFYPPTNRQPIIGTAAITLDEVVSRGGGTVGAPGTTIPI
jgi:hypothetical protein